MENSENHKKEWFGAGYFDPINSTFRNEIFCTSKKKLIGYSKGKFSNEPQDKIVLLEKWIVRLLNKGYFDSERIEKIEFYLKSFLKDEDKLIFTLYPDRYIMGMSEKYSLNERLIFFLNKFYKQVNERNIEFKNLIHKPIRQKEEQILNYKIKRFRDEFELSEFLLTKRKEGFEVSMLLGYAQNYREYHF